MAYNPYSNFYMQDLQSMKDRIDSQMRQIQQNQYQLQQQVPQVTQNFQLAPNPSNNELESKYANTIDEVKNTFVVKTGLFVNKDFTKLWVKDVSGKIKTYNLEEYVELDEKDKKILDQSNTILILQKQLEELKGVISNDADASTELSKTTSNKKSSRVSNSKSNDE
jgi:hypothetical protein